MREILYTLHDKSQTDEVTDLNEFKILAKRITTENSERYYIKEINSRVVNPFEVGLAEMRRDNGKMIEVTAEVYNLYHKVIAQTSRVSFTSIQNMMSS